MRTIPFWLLFVGLLAAVLPVRAQEDLSSLYDKAAGMLIEARQMPPGNERATKLSDAKTILLKIVTQKKESAQSWYFLAECQFRLEEYKDALWSTNQCMTYISVITDQKEMTRLLTDVQQLQARIMIADAQTPPPPPPPPPDPISEWEQRVTEAMNDAGGNHWTDVIRVLELELPKQDPKAKASLEACFLLGKSHQALLHWDNARYYYHLYLLNAPADALYKNDCDIQLGNVHRGYWAGLSLNSQPLGCPVGVVVP